MQSGISSSLLFEGGDSSQNVQVVPPLKVKDLVFRIRVAFGLSLLQCPDPKVFFPDGRELDANSTLQDQGVDRNAVLHFKP